MILNIGTCNVSAMLTINSFQRWHLRGRQRKFERYLSRPAHPTSQSEQNALSSDLVDSSKSHLHSYSMRPLSQWISVDQVGTVFFRLCVDWTTGQMSRESCGIQNRSSLIECNPTNKMELHLAISGVSFQCSIFHDKYPMSSMRSSHTLSPTITPKQDDQYHPVLLS